MTVGSVHNNDIGTCLNQRSCPARRVPIDTDRRTDAKRVVLIDRRLIQRGAQCRLARHDPLQFAVLTDHRGEFSRSLGQTREGLLRGGVVAKSDQ